MEEASKPLPTFKDTNTADLSLGGAPSAGHMAGLIDEVTVYSRALSNDEVKSCWKALAPATKPVTETVGEVRRFEGHTNGTWGVAFSPDGRHALSGAGDGTVRLWEVATGREVRRFSGHDGYVHGVAFSPDGRQALASSHDGTVRLWNVQTGKEIRVLKGHTNFVNRVAFSPDGRRALSGGEDETVRLWDLESGQELRRFPGFCGVAFSPDGRRALCGEPSGRIGLWDVETGAGVRRWLGHGGRKVTGVVFLPGGRQALSCGHDSQWFLVKPDILAMMSALVFKVAD
jgi:WD40 repeat protein